MILKLIAMIILGILSAALTYYKKNYYVRVFDDILGREEDDNTVAALGRSFVYGFLFPIYFVLLLAGLIALVGFLVYAGIVAGIAFVLVWVTEKIIPHEWFGNLMQSILAKIGIAPATKGEEEPSNQGKPIPPPATDAGPPPEPTSGDEDAGENPFPGGDINRRRVHKLD